MDPTLIGRYPFLPQAADYVRAEGPPVDQLMEARAWTGARTLGRDRVLAGLEGEPVPEAQTLGEHEALVSVLGYAVARLLVSLVDDEMVRNRYATAEARRLGEDLSADGDDVLLHVAGTLGIRTEVREDDTYAVPFADFLQKSRDLKALKWKLVNQDMDQGWVLLTRQRLTRLTQEALKLKLLEDLPLEVPPVVAEHLDTWAREVQSKAQEIRSQQVDLMGEGVEPDWFPPCIRSLISQIKASENVSHEGRFAVVAFLNTIGMNRDQIIEDLFSNVPDFARDITEYQVDHILGNKTKGESYTPPGCGTLQTYGLCPMMSKPKDDWDTWCSHEKMSHPLTYYRWGLFVQKKKDERGDPDGEAPEAHDGSQEDPPAQNS